MRNFIAPSAISKKGLQIRKTFCLFLANGDQKNQLVVFNPLDNFNTPARPVSLLI
jgi:hypothetical protein